MSNNIILIGYRGTGKSAVGQYISNKFNKTLISTDELIVDEVGPIPEFIDKNNWNKFREVEHRIISNIELKNGIIDCGGGVIETPENHEPLKKLGQIFWLTATADTIIERIKSSTNRPALSGNDFLSEIPEILKRRTPLYKKFSDYEIKTDDRSISHIASEIIDKFSKQI
ncbi:MAG TPA: shikimate kinase [bacterium]|nr:shikimate kinase [bacterium]